MVHSILSVHARVWRVRKVTSSEVAEWIDNAGIHHKVAEPAFYMNPKYTRPIKKERHMTRTEVRFKHNGKGNYTPDYLHGALSIAKIQEAIGVVLTDEYLRGDYFYYVPGSPSSFSFVRVGENGTGGLRFNANTTHTKTEVEWFIKTMKSAGERLSILIKEKALQEEARKLAELPEVIKATI
jgi:hypothetical protein